MDYLQKPLKTIEMSNENKPHCWGKMDWILKYPDGEEPRSSICNCEHGAYKCKSLTRLNSQENFTPEMLIAEGVVKIKDV
jgi:hypothetical protein